MPVAKVYTRKHDFSTSEDDFRRNKGKVFLMCSSTGTLEISESCMDVDDCIESDYGAHGLCRDLPDPVGNRSIHHSVCDSLPGTKRC